MQEEVLKAGALFGFADKAADFGAALVGESVEGDGVFPDRPHSPDVTPEGTVAYSKEGNHVVFFPFSAPTQ
ncbi:MAG TPA: hypothetical protein VHS06_02495 [Chloroflexota bacterium]|nr:hypothetical protein [Chloroflexota bacterium]